MWSRRPGAVRAVRAPGAARRVLLPRLRRRTRTLATTLRGMAGRAPGRRLLGSFLAALVPVVAIGASIGLVVHGELHAQGIAEARSEGVQLDRVIGALMGPALEVDRTPAEVATLTRDLGPLQSRNRLYGVQVAGPGRAATVDTGGPFARFRLDAAQRAAVAGGQVLTQVRSLPKGPGRAVAVSELTVPGDPAAGELTVFLPYGQVQSELADELSRIDLALGAGLAVLFVVLCLVIRSASRGLRREAGRNALLSRQDTLTGLPNRLALIEDADRLLRRSDGGQAGVSVVVCDLDQFKRVNDSLGHRVGDQLLSEVADRLRAAVRPGDFVARIGGDEFAAVLPGVTDVAAVRRLVERMAAALQAEVYVDGVALTVEASFGVAASPGGGTGADLLLQHAGAALSRSKGSESPVAFYDAALDDGGSEWPEMAGQLRTAMRSGGLGLQFQPKVALSTGALVGVEALLRWEHPERGAVPPEAFVAVAERGRSMGDLTAWVLDESLAQLARWDRTVSVPELAVNISTRNLHPEDRLPDVLAALLLRHRVDAERVVLEITETALFVDDAAARKVLQDLHRLGVRISIDDFGQGFAGIGYLRHMPVSELKVDKEFVLNMTASWKDHAIVRSAADLARRLGLECTAEGIASQELLEAARAAGCGLGQGFHISEPLDAGRFTEWARARSPRVGTARARGAATRQTVRDN